MTILPKVLVIVVTAALLPVNDAFMPRSSVVTKPFNNQPVSINPVAKPHQVSFPNRISPHQGSQLQKTTALSLGVDGGVEGSLSQSLLKLLLETVIVNGVPALFTLIVVGFIGWQFRPRKGDDEDGMVRGDPFNKQKKNPAAELYSDLYEGDEVDKPMSPFAFFKMFKPPVTPAATNRGIPTLQYITIKNLNQKYDSYDFSLTAATESKAKAAAAYRAKNFDRALRLGLNGANETTAISPFAKTTLLELEKEFLKSGSKLLNVIQSAQADLTKNAIDEKMKDMGMQPYELDPPMNATATADTDSNVTTATVVNETADLRPSSGGSGSDKKMKMMSNTAMNAKLTQLGKAQMDLLKLELQFIKDVVATLGTERATGIRTAMVGDIEARGTGGLLTQLQDRPLSVLLSSSGLSTTHSTTNEEEEQEPLMTEEATLDHRRKSVFVTRFPGDTTASQVAELREEVTAIVRNAKPGDEAIVILQTGGGTVTGYGLAAAQLLRFKDAGMKLTIAVEQVAASGGYMMCCVADKIVSSPFAVLGSIGVITDIPNVYERLKKEGIEFQTVTAGKYKRTITPTKQVTKEDFEKTKQDVEKILVLFKQFVHQNRPNLDIDEVATGETWFGEDALERGLTDEIKTADEVLTEYVDKGWDVYEVEYTPPEQQALALSGVPGGSTAGIDEAQGSSAGVARRVIRWAVRTLVQEVKAELGSSVDLQQRASPEQRYMMIDDSADRVRSEYK